jgi:hypothetical protein
MVNSTVMPDNRIALSVAQERPQLLIAWHAMLIAASRHQATARLFMIFHHSNGSYSKYYLCGDRERARD